MGVAPTINRIKSGRDNNLFFKAGTSKIIFLDEEFLNEKSKRQN